MTMTMVVVCRVFSLNAHVMMCQLFEQERNWGALCHWKDLWQEEAVRIVTSRLAQRAKRVPETTYANDRYVRLGCGEGMVCLAPN